jgi:hypothetical protein
MLKFINQKHSNLPALLYSISSSDMFFCIAVLNCIATGVLGWWGCWGVRGRRAAEGQTEAGWHAQHASLFRLFCWAKSVFLFVLSLHSHIFHDMNSHHPSQASSNRKLLSLKRLTYFLDSARHICRRQTYGWIKRWKNKWGWKSSVTVGLHKIEHLGLKIIIFFCNFNGEYGRTERNQ